MDPQKFFRAGGVMGEALRPGEWDRGQLAVPKPSRRLVPPASGPRAPRR